MTDRYRELLAINRAIASAEGYDEILARVVARAAAFMRADACLLLLVDDDGLTRVAHSVGLDPARAGGLALPLSENLGVELSRHLGLGATAEFLGVPVVGKEGVMGLLAVYRPHRPGAVEAEDATFLSALADQAAISLDNAARTQELLAAAAREAAHRNEARLRAHVENSPLAVVEFDPRLTVIGWSSAAERLFGWTADEVLGRPVSALRWIHEDDLASVEQEASHLLSGERARSMLQNRNLHKSGAVIHCEWYNSGIRDESGTLLSILSQVLDVTERHRAEVKLREREARQASILDAVKESIWLFSPAGVALAANQTALARWGRPAESIIGHPMLEVLPEGLGRSRLALIEEVARSGREIVAEDVRGATRFEHTYYPVAGPDGRVESVAVFSRDVTDTRRAAEELAVATRLYAVLSRVNEAIVRTHEEVPLLQAVCRILAEEVGFPLAWVGRLQGRQVVPVAQWGRAVDYLREIRVEVDGDLGNGPTGTCIREGKPQVNDDFGSNPRTWPWREQSQRHGLEASAAIPLWQGGQVVGALTLYAATTGAFTAKQIDLLQSLGADLSYALDALELERRRGEAERGLREQEQLLREADQRKSEFLAVLSHELRNPLAPIRNSLFILQSADAAPGQLERARAVIERQTNHLARLVDDLLDVTRITNGKIELRRERVDLVEQLTRAADDLRSIVDGRGLALEVVLPPAPLWAEADPTRLGQILSNLIQNSAKFSRPGDRVTLALRRIDGSAEFSVRDTGAGIDPALLPTLFDPFVQGKRTLARSEGGLGLGLALVKGLTELHGGQVSARSAGIGLGSEFTVRIPALAAPLPEAHPAGPQAPRRPGRRRVLIVDDNQDGADSLAEVVKMLGHSAVVAYDGHSAVERVRSTPLDLVLCDIGLPGMSGYEVARTLRSEGARMPLFALTGYSQAEDVRAALAAGFDGHLAKPVDIADIERLLE